MGKFNRIVKVQRPLGPKEPKPMWLIYEGAERLNAEMRLESEIPPAVRKAVEASSKSYFYATRAKGVWMFGNQAPLQEW